MFGDSTLTLKTSRPVFASIEIRCVSMRRQIEAVALNRQTFIVAAAADA